MTTNPPIDYEANMRKPSTPIDPIEWMWWGVLIVSVALGLGLTWFGPN